MDENIINEKSSSQVNKGRIKGLSDFVLIIRDRWLLSITIALPIALGFVYTKLQGPNFTGLHLRSDLYLHQRS